MDSVPLRLCKEKNIRVSYTPDAVSPAVIELTLGLILDLFRHITFADRQIRLGNWTRPYGKRIGDSVIGIIGFGRIGSGVAMALSSLSPRKIFVNDIIDKSKEINNIKNRFHADITPPIKKRRFS